jgi:hypothetical protein
MISLEVGDVRFQRLDLSFLVLVVCFLLVGKVQLEKHQTNYEERIVVLVILAVLMVDSSALLH